MGVARASDYHQPSTKGDDVNNSSQLFSNPDNARMTSLEIAEIVGARHDKVKQSIERLVARMVIGLPPLGVIQTATKPKSFYTFEGEQGKRDSYVVVAQLCPEFTARLVDRWQELEKQRSQPQLPQSMAEALRLAADQAERLEQQERALQAAAPKIAFAKAVELSHDAITVGQAAKVIGTGRTRLFAFLRQHSWVTRRNEPYQSKIDAGLLDTKIGHWEHPEQGLQETVTALVTGKGLVKLQQLWESERGQAA
ncbi:DNA-binding protein [Halomonas sp. A020]|nr:DNA-binding protein [Halomonas sp. A020]